MLKPALLYKDQLDRKFSEILLDEKYMYFFMESGQPPQISDDLTNLHQLVSVDRDGRLIGYIAYSINNKVYYAYDFEAVNFTDNKILFGKDLKNAIDDIFYKYHFNKLNFMSVDDNPATSQYERLIQKYGGRFVGYYEEDIMLLDGRVCDTHLFEIFAGDWMQHTKIK